MKEKNAIDEDYQKKIDEINFLNEIKTLDQFNNLKSRISELIKSLDDAPLLRSLKNRIVGNEVFHDESVIDLFLELIPSLNGIARRFIWEAFMDIIRQENNKELKPEFKQRILVEMKTSCEVSTKIYLYRRYRSILAFSDWLDVFENNKQTRLQYLKVSNVKDLINETLILLTSEKLILKDHYQDLVGIIKDFEDKEEKYILEKLTDFVNKALSLWGFSEKNEVLSLFMNFCEVERKLLMTLGSGYHEHILHSFRVFLFGFQFLAIIRDFNNRLYEQQYNIDVLGWIITSFFHDLGYGVEKVHKLTSSIQKSYQILGNIDASSFIISESARIIAERVMNSLERIIVGEQSEYMELPKEFEFLKIHPILKSWENKDHGIISAVILWRSLIELVSRDYTFYLKYHSIWDDIFLRAALAMTLHSIHPKLTYYLNYDLPQLAPEGYSPMYIREEHPLLLSFILHLFDTVDFIERRTFIGKTYLDIPKPQIKLELEIDIQYSLKNYVEIIVNCIYDDINDKDLIELADKIFPKFYGYVSYDYGVRISIQNKKSKRKIEIPLLRSEFENFDNYINEKKIKLQIKEMNESHTIYREYFYSVLSLNGFERSEIETAVEDRDLKNFIPERISFQIYCFYGTKKRFQYEFNEFVEEESFKELFRLE